MGRQCVILAGGVGSRLGGLATALPKSLLPVRGRPFLDYLLAHVGRFGFDDVVVLAGHRGGAFDKYPAPQSARIRISREPSPLGTAGALRHGAALLDRDFLLINGDCLFAIDIAALCTPLADGRLARLALCQMADPARFGVCERGGDRVTAFYDRPAGTGPALVNAGMYWMTRKLVAAIGPGTVSLEADVFPRLDGRVFDAPFIDIGTPVDYRRGQTDIPDIDAFTS